MIVPTEQQWGFILGESLEAKKEAIVELMSASLNQGDIAGLAAGLATRITPEELDNLIQAVSGDLEFLRAIGVDVPEPETDAPLPYSFSSSQIDTLISGSGSAVRSILLSVNEEAGFNSLGSGLMITLGSTRLQTLLERVSSDVELWDGLNFPAPGQQEIEAITAEYVPFSGTVEALQGTDYAAKRSAILEIFSERSTLSNLVDTLAQYFTEDQLSSLSMEFASDQSFWATLGASPPTNGVAQSVNARLLDDSAEHSLNCVGMSDYSSTETIG